MLKGFRSGGIIGGNVPGFAEGGYVRGGAQLITVAEEGAPEAIIPLGKHRRKRAMELFGQVGSYLQAPGFARRVLLLAALSVVPSAAVLAAVCRLS